MSDNTIINKIKEGIYEGYIWQSNEKQPRVLKKEHLDEIDLQTIGNPFIMEAQLKDETCSISIKFVDGKYRVHQYNLNELAGEKQEISFYANRMSGVKKLIFAQYWKPVVDPNCLNMEVLTPQDFVFLGFKYEEE